MRRRAFFEVQRKAQQKPVVLGKKTPSRGGSSTLRDFDTRFQLPFSRCQCWLGLHAGSTGEGTARRGGIRVRPSRRQIACQRREQNESCANILLQKFAVCHKAANVAVSRRKREKLLAQFCGRRPSSQVAPIRLRWPEPRGRRTSRKPGDMCSSLAEKQSIRCRGTSAAVSTSSLVSCCVTKRCSVPGEVRPKNFVFVPWRFFL